LERKGLIKEDFFYPVVEGLRAVEDRMLNQSDRFHPDLNIAMLHLINSGGKRVRVAVTLLVGGMLNANPDRLISLAAAIELLHTATLVHDDLIDGSMMRRGNPTLNSKWSPAATVLTGDFFFANAARLAAETDSIPVMKLFSETLAVIVNGEIGQMFSRRGLATREEYDRRIYAKTASLFETAATSAAILSGCDEGQISKAGRYGYGIGMAFQIVDDVLDFTGNQDKVGKPVGSDLRQGLITLPAIYYLRENPDNPALGKILARGSIVDQEFERLIHDIRFSGAVDRALDDAGRFADQGVEALRSLPDCEERVSLENMAHYIVHRKL
jgi:geranylgeranyl pyrophosphate synthase